jgi:Protein of unknown function (DUF2934)
LNDVWKYLIGVTALVPTKTTDTKTVKPDKKSTPKTKSATLKKVAVKSSVKGTRSKEATLGAASTAIDLAESIRLRAYEIYRQRGGGHGLDQNDWLQAEAEILKSI